LQIIFVVTTKATNENKGEKASLFFVHVVVKKSRENIQNLSVKAYLSDIAV